MNQPLIDKHIPLPMKYPFDGMEVGDSFLVPSHVNRTTVSVAAKRWGEKHDVKFTIRMTEDRKLRCWRIA